MMNLVYLSSEDLTEVFALFTQFHESYTSFFQNGTKSVSKPATDYLQGQLFTKQRMNLSQFFREVPDSDYEAMQHFISGSPWDDSGCITKLQRDVLNLLGDKDLGALT